jgi:hypothetical protein
MRGNRLIARGGTRRERDPDDLAQPGGPQQAPGSFAIRAGGMRLMIQPRPPVTPYRNPPETEAAPPVGERLHTAEPECPRPGQASPTAGTHDSQLCAGHQGLRPMLQYAERVMFPTGPGEILLSAKKIIVHSRRMRPRDVDSRRKSHSDPRARPRRRDLPRPVKAAGRSDDRLRRRRRAGRGGDARRPPPTGDVASHGRRLHHLRRAACPAPGLPRRFIHLAPMITTLMFRYAAPPGYWWGQLPPSAGQRSSLIWRLAGARAM